MPSSSSIMRVRVCASRAEKGSSMRRTAGSTASARDTDPLAHPPRELVGILALEALEAGHGDETRRAVPTFRGRHTKLFEAELHVASHGPPWKEGELLEHGGGERLMGAALPLENDLARGSAE